MKTTLETDTAHAIQALEQAGFAQSDRIRLVAERLDAHAPQRGMLHDIIEHARREAPLKGLSEMVASHVREFRANFTVDPARRDNPDRQDHTLP